MNNLKKLIENGGWRPISEAPKDGTEVHLLGEGFYEKGAWRYKEKYFFGDYDKEEGYAWRDDCLISLGEPTHFMPLDTPERMARVIEAFINAYSYSVIDAFIDAELGKPDDVFNKYHLDKGELQFFLSKLYNQFLKQVEQIAGGVDENSQYLSDLKPEYAPDLRQPSLLKQTPMRTTYGTNDDE